MTLTPFHKRLFVRLGVAVGSIAVLGTAVTFLNSHITKETDEIVSQKAQIALRAQTLELITGTNSDLKKAEPLLARIQGILPPVDSLVSFERYLKLNAKDYNVAAGFTIKNQREATQDTPGSIDFELAVTGQLDDIIDFLMFIERHPYFIRFEGMSISYTSSQYSLITNGSIFAR